MSVMKFARNAAITAAAVLMPAQAIAATPLSTAFDQMRAGATLDEENDQFGEYNDYLVPVIVIVAISIGIFFIIDSGEDDKPPLNLPTSP